MALRKTGRAPTALQGGSRGGGVLAADPAGRPYSIPFSELPSVAGTGDVTGPSSAADNALARFNGTTGKHIQDGLAILEDDGRITHVTDPTGAQDVATKAYVDTHGGGGAVGLGTYGLLVEDGATAPPVTLYSEDGTDWLYADGA